MANRGLLGRDGVGMLLAEPTSGPLWKANRGAISLVQGSAAGLRALVCSIRGKRIRTNALSR